MFRELLAKRRLSFQTSLQNADRERRAESWNARWTGCAACSPAHPDRSWRRRRQVTQKGVESGAVGGRHRGGDDADVDRITHHVFGDACTSAVQLQVFAAPKTTGVWYGIRREIAEAIVAGGGTAEEVDGPLGTELRVRMPSQGPDGRTTFSPARFVGVDGPRWFLRAVLSGDAATDDEAAARAMEFVRTVVVHRGSDPRAPRELLELALPPELMAQAQASAQEHEQHTDAPTVGPLERGPEITETR